jgi:hypothetical protein
MRLRWLGTCAVAIVVATACGSSGRGNSPTGGSAGASATASGGGGGEKFGTLASPCGKGSAKGATDQGVTDSTITIAYGDDRGFAQSPGLSHQIGDADAAMIKWCNNQGGINGRKIVGKFYDAKITDANRVTTEACKSAFMQVATGWALDSSAEQTRVACNLVAVEAYSVSPDFAMGPMQYEGLPNPADIYTGSGFAQMAKIHPEVVKKAAQFTTTLATENTSSKKAVEGSKKFGFQWLPCTQTINFTGEPDYKPFMQKLKDCGAKFVYTAVSPGPVLFNMLQAAAQVHFEPIWLSESNTYTSEFAAFNKNKLGDNFYSRLAFVPFEQADKNPATKQYLDIVKGDGGDVSVLGAQATSSFLLWASAAKECGSTLTRQCMLNKLSKVTDWTAGGLHAATSPGGNQPPQCGVLVRLQGTKWTQAFPTKDGFDCSPSYLVKAKVVGITLNKDRVATKYLSSKVLKAQP